MLRNAVQDQSACRARSHSHQGTLCRSPAMGESTSARPAQRAQWAARSSAASALAAACSASARSASHLASQVLLACAGRESGERGIRSRLSSRLFLVNLAEQHLLKTQAVTPSDNCRHYMPRENHNTTPDPGRGSVLSTFSPSDCPFKRILQLRCMADATQCTTVFRITWRGAQRLLHERSRLPEHPAAAPPGWRAPRWSAA